MAARRVSSWKHGKHISRGRSVAVRALQRKVMENVHLVPESENDDLYSGYDYNDPMLEVLSLR